MSPTVTPEMGTLKTRLKATWNSGDYATFAKPMEPGALEFLYRLAVPAARAGVNVTGVDIVTNQIEHAQAPGRAERLNARFEEGDAEALEHSDGSFDVVVSLIGAMFAPRPERVAAELLRTANPAVGSSSRTGRRKVLSARCSRPSASTCHLRR